VAAADPVSTRVRSGPVADAPVEGIGIVGHPHLRLASSEVAHQSKTRSAARAPRHDSGRVRLRTARTPGRTTLRDRATPRDRRGSRCGRGRRGATRSLAECGAGRRQIGGVGRLAELFEVRPADDEVGTVGKRGGRRRAAAVMAARSGPGCRAGGENRAGPGPLRRPPKGPTPARPARVVR